MTAEAPLPLPGVPPATRPTPPISVGAARAAIAARLASLKHKPDFLDEAAVQLLILRAGGSHRKLRASLDTTLFLAGTERVPRIDSGLVRRALQGGAPTPGPARSRSAMLLRRLAWPALALAVCVLVVAVWPRHQPVSPPIQLAETASHPAPLPPIPSAAKPSETRASQPSPEPSKPVVSQTTEPVLPEAAKPAPPLPSPASEAPEAPKAVASVARPPASAPLAAPKPVQTATNPPSPAQAPPPAPAPPQAKNPPAPAPALPPLAPAVVVDSLAVPPHAPPAEPTVVILYQPGDATTGTRLASLTRRLRQVGVAEIDARAAPPGIPGRVVSFFFDTDRALAQRVTGVLANEGWPNLPGGELPPGLVRRHPGLATVRRGMVELQLP